MRVLVTGVSGFVGGHLAEHLIESGDLVVGCRPAGAGPRSWRTCRGTSGSSRATWPGPARRTWPP